MGKINKEKIREFFKNKRNLKIMILVTSFIILTLIIWLLYSIYANDKPNFIPKETRGDIREGIKDTIAKPIEYIAPSLGKTILNAAHKEETEETVSNQDNPNVASDEMANWQTYKSDEYGFEVSYPEGYFIRESSNGISIIDNGNKDFQGEYPYIGISSYGGNGLSVNNWINANAQIFIGDQSPSLVEGFDKRTSVNLGKHNVVFFDWSGMGMTRAYTFNRDNKIIVVTVLTADDARLIDIAEKMIINIE